MKKDRQWSLLLGASPYSQGSQKPMVLRDCLKLFFLLRGDSDPRLVTASCAAKNPDKKSLMTSCFIIHHLSSILALVPKLYQLCASSGAFPRGWFSNAKFQARPLPVIWHTCAQSINHSLLRGKSIGTMIFTIQKKYVFILPPPPYTYIQTYTHAYKQTYPQTYTHTFTTYVASYLSIRLSVYLSSYLSIDRSIYRSIDPSIYLSIYLLLATISARTRRNKQHA